MLRVMKARLSSGPSRTSILGDVVEDLDAFDRPVAASLGPSYRVMTRVLAAKSDPKPPYPVKLLNRFPFLRRIPARIVGIGFRPEHVRSPIAAGPIAMSGPSGPMIPGPKLELEA